MLKNLKNDQHTIEYHVYFGEKVDRQNMGHTCTQKHKSTGNVPALKPLVGFVSIHYMLYLLLSHSVMYNSLQPHGLQHSRLPCPSLSPGVCSDSGPLSQ